MLAFNPFTTFWSRISATRLSLIYICLSVLYCILTTTFAVHAWFINQQAGDVIKEVFQSANVSFIPYAHLEPHSGELFICNPDLDSMKPRACPQLWPPQDQISQVQARSVRIIPVVNKTNQVDKVNLEGLDDLFGSDQGNGTVQATLLCVQAMKWPLQHLLNLKREDFAFIAFQIWVLGVSVMAILNESIPHAIAAFVTHLLAAFWSSFQLWSTNNFRREYSKLIMGVNDPDGFTGLLGGPGACDGQDMLPTYFKPRMDAELATAILNFVSVFASAYLTWRLIKILGWGAFKRVGASVTIHRLYRLALTHQILIQLSLFFIIASMALWIDQLFSGVFGPHALLLELYKIFNIVTFVLLIPWLTLGWFAVRKEWRRRMLVFILLSFYMLLSWIAGTFSGAWRLTFMHWRFFSGLQVGAFLCVFLTTVVGLACRVYCFGRGLAEYINGEAQDPQNDDFKPMPDLRLDEEKVGFPSTKDEVLPQLPLLMTTGADANTYQRIWRLAPSTQPAVEKDSQARMSVLSSSTTIVPEVPLSSNRTRTST